MEREILFCITALQMGLTTVEDLRRLGKDLSERRINSIRAELIKRANISPEWVRTIEKAVDLTASFNNGDFKKVLSSRIYKKM